MADPRVASNATPPGGQYNLPSDKGAVPRVQLTPQLMSAIKKIESGGNPNAVTGSYKGLYQLSDEEFRRLGGRGDIFNPQENERIAALKLQGEANQVAAKLGRALTPGEIYLVHQQGTGGAYAHLTNPDQPAWKSMHSTGEGQQKGENWARQAIWGNVPDKDKARYGSVDNLTSRDFAQLWSDRVTRGIGGGAADDGATGYGGIGSDAAASARAEAAAARPAVAPGATATDTAAAAAPAAPEEKAKDYRGDIGDAFAQMGKLYATGPVAQNAARASSPANLPLPQAPMAQGPVPMVDPKMADAQRQQLAAALQRLNSGRSR
jgi:hypothetical protein